MRYQEVSLVDGCSLVVPIVFNPPIMTINLLVACVYQPP